MVPAAVTVALVPPIYTMLLVVVALKPLPVIVIEEPGMLTAVLSEEITGGATWASVMLHNKDRIPDSNKVIFFIQLQNGGKK